MKKDINTHSVGKKQTQIVLIFGFVFDILVLEVFKLENSVCFIGHRKINTTDELKQKVRNTVTQLIENEGIVNFIFGSRSEFNSLCHDIVTQLQEKYPNIKRIVFTCRHEFAILKESKAEIERIHEVIHKEKCSFEDYDEEYEHPTKYSSGRANYVERNQAMIKESDICIFYYDEKYLPPKHKTYDYQPNSGTALAYEFAKQKKKRIINLI